MNATRLSIAVGNSTKTARHPACLAAGRQGAIALPLCFITINQIMFWSHLITISRELLTYIEKEFE